MLPLTAAKGDVKAKQYQQLELAKDIAAMANSGGGMIVYGVAETRGTGTSVADKIVPIGLVDETTTRDIRRVAGNLIYPPVAAIELLPLAPEDDPAGGVLVMFVPDSLDRPHLVHPSNGTDWFGAPYRHGPETVWMVERQLASAYSEREVGRRRRTAEFHLRFDEFTASLPADPDLRWVVAIAVPEQPGTRPRDLHLAKANGIIERAWQSPLSCGFGPRDLTKGEPTRRGLQRFFRTGSRVISAAARARAQARVEVHGDGTAAIAFTRDGAIVGEGRQPTQVPVSDIESAAMDFLALLMQVRETIGVTGDYFAGLTVHPPTEIFRRIDPVLRGSLVPWDQHRVLGYRPVTGVVIGTAGLEEMLNSWVDLAADAVHQAGAPCTLEANQMLNEIRIDE